MAPMATVGAPAIHGPVGTGMHGIGVGTPSAAAVAAITIGLLMLVHIPNGGTFTIGAKSMMVAAGTPSTLTRLAGNTTRELGATPKLHCSEAPRQTQSDMARLSGGDGVAAFVETLGGPDQAAGQITAPLAQRAARMEAAPVAIGQAADIPRFLEQRTVGIVILL